MRLNVVRVTHLDVTADLICRLRDIVPEEVPIGPSSNLADLVDRSTEKRIAVREELLSSAVHYGVGADIFLRDYNKSILGMSIEEFSRYICENSRGLMHDGA